MSEVPLGSGVYGKFYFCRGTFCEPLPSEPVGR